MMLGQLVRVLLLLGMMLQELGRLHTAFRMIESWFVLSLCAALCFLSGQFG